MTTCSPRSWTWYQFLWKLSCQNVKDIKDIFQGTDDVTDYLDAVQLHVLANGSQVELDSLIVLAWAAENPSNLNLDGIFKDSVAVFLTSQLQRKVIGDFAQLAQAAEDWQEELRTAAKVRYVGNMHYSNDRRGGAGVNHIEPAGGLRSDGCWGVRATSPAMGAGAHR